MGHYSIYIYISDGNWVYVCHLICDFNNIYCVSLAIDPMRQTIFMIFISLDMYNQK